MEFGPRPLIDGLGKSLSPDLSRLPHLLVDLAKSSQARSFREEP